MNIPITPILLRRTAVALFAAVSFAGSLPAFAQTSNLLKRSTGETVCSYTGLSVTPNGNVIVTCDSGGVVNPPPPAGESFSITTSPSSLAVNTSALVLVTRVNGVNSTATINYTVTGGCLPTSGVFWIGTARPTEGFQITAPASGASCTVSITTDTGSLATPSSVTVPITGGGGGGGGTTGNGCPAVPNDVADFTLKLSGADVQRLASGRIASATLPTIGTQASAQFVLGETTSSPRAATVEASINKCRGVIDTNAGFCYLRTDNPSLTGFTWLERPPAGWGVNTDTYAAAYGLCKAYASDGPYYLNMRYTYSSSSCSLGICGFVSQWNYAAW